MGLELKTMSSHLALTHKLQQPANGRNISLLMKTKGIANSKLLNKVGLKKSAYYNNIWGALNDTLEDLSEEAGLGCYTWLVDFNDTTAVFCTEDDLYSVGYSFDEATNEATITDTEATPVSRMVTYTPNSEEKLSLEADTESELGTPVFILMKSALLNKDNIQYIKPIMESKMQDVEKAVQERTASIEALFKAKENEQTQALLKAQEQIKQLQEAQKAIVMKSRVDMLSKVESSPEKAEALYKATESLDEAQFQVIMKSLAEKQEMASNSPMFKEMGTSHTPDIEGERKESSLVAMIKAAYPEQYKNK